MYNFFNDTPEDLDHTADVQCHSWGKSILEAFENMAPCMLNYMTDIMLVNPDESIQLEVRGEGNLIDRLLRYM